MAHTRGDTGQSLVMEHASIEEMIESLSAMAEQTVMLARGIQKKVEDLKNVRERLLPDGAEERRTGSDRRQ